MLTCVLPTWGMCPSRLPGMRPNEVSLPHKLKPRILRRSAVSATILTKPIDPISKRFAVSCVASRPMLISTPLPILHIAGAIQNCRHAKTRRKSRPCSCEGIKRGKQKTVGRSPTARVRRVTHACIPRAARIDSEGGLWVNRLTRNRKT